MGVIMYLTEGLVRIYDIMRVQQALSKMPKIEQDLSKRRGHAAASPPPLPSPSLSSPSPRLQEGAESFLLHSREYFADTLLGLL